MHVAPDAPDGPAYDPIDAALNPFAPAPDPMIVTLIKVVPAGTVQECVPTVVSLNMF